MIMNILLLLDLEKLVMISFIIIVIVDILKKNDIINNSLFDKVLVVL